MDSDAEKIVLRSRELRKQIEKTSETMDDESAVDYIELFPSWSGDGIEYNIGHRVRYNGVLYKVITQHKSTPTWAPDVSPSLFAEVLAISDDIILEWKQPDSTNPYMKGDKVIFDNNVYESLIDGNVWSPADYPGSWHLIE